MKGDFSRITFDRQHHFSRVLMQQGRVLLDADWNEQTSILLHYLRSLAADLIGAHGGPAQGPYRDGFRVVCENDLKCDFIIHWGHYYVDGILCEHLPPVQCPPQAAPPLTYAGQPDYPLTEEMELQINTDYLVYLDVWERHLTYVQADHLREVALGGPDTATRARLVCQVKAAEVPKDAPEDATCAELMDALVHDGPRCLRARARVETPSDDPCILPPEARYRGPENQLYRVEIHDGGTADTAKGGATFKWSRDNGSVVFPIRSLQGSLASVDTLGPDDQCSLDVGDWVEIIDDTIVLQGTPGILAKVQAVDRVSYQVTLGVPEGTALPVYDEDSTTHPLLRRWDQGADALPVREGSWIDLEDGVQVYFEPGGTYRTGDYWMIPARTATGDVLWPTEVRDDGTAAPQALPPHGIRHHYAPLARISLDGAGTVSCDDNCRCTFDPLCAAASPAEESAPAIEAVQATPPGIDTCEDSSVRFTATVRGTPPLSYRWAFDDGTTSTAEAPSHHYTRPGTYTVRLTVRNALGEDAATLSVGVAPCEGDVPPPQPQPIPFAANVASLSTAGREVALRNAELLRERLQADTQLRASVVGYVAPDEANAAAELSTARAQLVHDIYAETGISSNRMSVRGAGVDETSDLPVDAQRRVETTLASTAANDERLEVLRRIDRIGESRARDLLAAGHTTPHAVAELTVDALRELLGVGEDEAQRIRESARQVAEATG